MNSEIKAGYQIHFTTWENDADAYRTQVVSGLTNADVEFYLDLASHFSSHNWGDRTGYGNKAIKEDELSNLIIKILSRHDVSDETRNDWDESGDADWIGVDREEITDYLYEMLCTTVLGYPVNEYYCSEGMFCRVMASWKVYRVPEDLVDVTENFRKMK